MDRAECGVVMEMAIVRMPWSKDEEHEHVKNSEDDEESERSRRVLKLSAQIS